MPDLLVIIGCAERRRWRIGRMVFGARVATRPELGPCRFKTIGKWAAAYGAYVVIWSVVGGRGHAAPFPCDAT
jgi:hypothetical protein